MEGVVKSVEESNGEQRGYEWERMIQENASFASELLELEDQKFFRETFICYPEIGYNGHACRELEQQTRMREAYWLLLASLEQLA